MSSQASTLVIVVVCVVVGGLVSIFSFKEDEGPVKLDEGLRGEIGSLKEELARNRDEIENLRQALAQRNANPAPATSSGLDEAQVRRLIAAALAERPAENAVARTEEKDAAGAPFNLERELARFIATADSWDDRQKFWADLADRGLLKQAVAWFEQRAKNSPNDAEAIADLGESYIAMIQRGGINQLEMGVYGTKADKAFDRALELDETHWRSRFQKATSLSFWPPAMGRQPEAIKHFEILVSQQKNQPAKPEFAATHFFLGNMYAQQGNMDQAQESWKAGLEIDPNNEELKKKMNLFEK